MSLFSSCLQVATFLVNLVRFKQVRVKISECQTLRGPYLRWQICAGKHVNHDLPNIGQTSLNHRKSYIHFVYVLFMCYLLTAHILRKLLKTFMGAIL